MKIEVVRDSFWELKSETKNFLLGFHFVILFYFIFHFYFKSNRMLLCVAVSRDNQIYSNTGLQEKFRTMGRSRLLIGNLIRTYIYISTQQNQKGLMGTALANMQAMNEVMVT